MRESAIERSVCAAARAAGWTVHPKAAVGTRGWPDRTFSRVVDGRTELRFVEFKAPGRRPTKLQSHRLAELHHAGYTTYIVDSADYGASLFAR